ncbi:surfactin synthetase subunit 3 [Penicillium malachiteum]|uniref:Surfactin synthetase subunit 3 n=1 Tax=Penicillium malachiteum TaxID=1324776 RepID=A0AAD6HUA8_9EURO|nr:surfactin synthetase subunit 3 [Penicillium malachiteum]
MLINNWNTFGTMQKHCRCMHDVIFGAADLNPSVQAIFSSSKSFTYQELRRASVLLGTYLMSIGVEGGVVPICADKSPLVVIAMLAVLHAGAAFVLLDEHLPEDRLRQNIRRVNSKVIIISEKSETVFQGMASSSITEPPPEHSNKKIDSSSLAYIAFTSSTTGEPKGILVNHDNFVTGALPRSDQIDYFDHRKFTKFLLSICIRHYQIIGSLTKDSDLPLRTMTPPLFGEHMSKASTLENPFDASQLLWQDIMTTSRIGASDGHVDGMSRLALSEADQRVR